LRWSELPCGNRECATVDELERALRGLAVESEDQPSMLALIETPKHDIVIGVGRPLVPLTVSENGSADVRYEWISIGDPGQRGEVDFFLCGHHSPCEARALIPFETAVRAALLFVGSGSLSPDVKWEENCF
jgi:Immunity protein Imm1